MTAPRDRRVRAVVGAFVVVIGVTALASAVFAGSVGPHRAAPRRTEAQASGDLLLSSGNGAVEERAPDGTLVQTLNSGVSSAENTGSAFDASGNFYVTEFQGNAVSKFDATGAPAGTFGSGYGAHPGSIVFDASGNAFVGQADGSRKVLEFDGSGNPIGSFAPATEDRGTEWIDLLPDNCTLQYTSEGTSLKQFDVCTNTQLADFATALPGDNAYAHRWLSDNTALVADTNFVVRVDSSGTVLHTYTPAESFTTLEALAVAPDGKSFWTADLFTGRVFHFDIASGDELGTFLLGHEVAGISVRGAVQLSDQTITFDPLGDATLGDPPVTAHATASSGLPVTFSTTTPDVCTVDGATITLVGSGTCTVEADQAGDATHNAAPPVQQSFTVAPQATTTTSTTTTTVPPTTTTTSTTTTTTVPPTTTTTSTTTTSTTTTSTTTTSTTTSSTSTTTVPSSTTVVTEGTTATTATSSTTVPPTVTTAAAPTTTTTAAPSTGPSTFPFTGASGWPPLVGLGALLMGGTLWLVARRRRATRA